MRLILAVFDALRTFDRPATRAEIEREAGLTFDEVHKGLRGLMRRGALVMDGKPRCRSVYALTDGAQRPADLRGRYKRTAEGRAAIAARARDGDAFLGIIVLDEPLHPYRAAMPPSHRAQPGSLRTATVAQAQRKAVPVSFSPCLLASVWRKTGGGGGVR